MRHRWHGDRGSIAPLLILTMGMSLLIAALGVELGLAYSVRQRQQVASDAAGLAGALHAVPYLQLQVPQAKVNCYQDENKNDHCDWDYRSVLVPADGPQPEQNVLPRWRTLAGCGQDGWLCQGTPSATYRQARYPADTSQVVTKAFEVNRPKGAMIDGGVDAVTATDGGSVQVSTWIRFHTALARATVPVLRFIRRTEASPVLPKLPWEK